MKKLIILITASLYFFGCEKIPDSIIDNNIIEFQVTALSIPENLTFNTNDSSFISTIRINNFQNISEVWMNIYSPSGKKLNSTAVLLLDNGIITNGDMVQGDGTFSAKYFLSRTNVTGKYNFEFFVDDRESNQEKVAIHTMNYYNNQQNYPPVISNLIFPDTVFTGPKNYFVFTLKAYDPNSQEDIKDVFFKFVRLENNTESDFIAMYDDGNFDIHGDSQADDGIYSFRNYFEIDTQGKSRLFIFQARDRSDSLSNIITHKVVVK